MIKESAIQRISDGRIWTGRRHDDVIHKIVSEGHALSVPNSKFIQGFVTDIGRFVDRHEAYKIAVECKQLLHPDKPLAQPTLMSEDLY